EMLSITDREFQSDLLKTAKANCKIDRNFELKNAWRENSRSALQSKLQPFKQAGLLPNYPFGSDFTDIEQRLIPVLQKLQRVSRSKVGILKLAAVGLLTSPDQADQDAVKRLDLLQPKSMAERITRLALLAALRDSR
ncbi:MAG: acetyl-CoA hydrolase, partial [Gammaproteobacteria bacterium]|nr:acetyl-CoA hydrolase [Gammaproteobacteria bacterium]